MLARLSTLGSFLTAQGVPYKLSLVCRKPFPSAKKIKEDVAVFNKDWAQYLGCLGNLEFMRMLLGIVAAPMIEYDGRKRAGACGFP